MAPRKKNIDLVWTNRDRSVEARLVALIVGIDFLDGVVVQGDAESICSIRVSVDNDPDAAAQIALHLEQPRVRCSDQLDLHGMAGGSRDVHRDQHHAGPGRRSRTARRAG